MANRALIITSGNYADPALPPLRAAANDGERFAAVLHRTVGEDFDVAVLRDAPLLDTQVAIQELFSQAGPDDLNVLLLSGHGVRDAAGRFYYAVVETKASYLAASALSGLFIRDQLQDSAARRNLILLDTCYAGAFGRDFLAKRADPIGGVPGELENARGVIVIAASSPVQLAFESADSTPHSVFTRAVCEGLETGLADADGDGWVTANDLFEYARERMAEERSDQTPELSSVGVNADLKIFRIGRGHGALQLDPDVASAVSSIHAELRSAGLSVLQKYGASFNDGRRATARHHLRSLRDDPDPQIRRAAEGALAKSRRRPRLRSPQFAGAPGNRDSEPVARLEVANRSLRVMAGTLPDFAGDDPYRPTFTQVEITAANGSLQHIVTNRYQLDVAWIPTISADRDLVFGVRAADLAALRRLPASGRALIEVFDDHVGFSTGDKFLSVQRTDVDSFPRMDKLIDRTGPQFRVDRHEIIDAIEQVMDARPGAKVVRLLVDSAEDILVVSSEVGRSAITIRQDHGLRPIRTAFSSQYLLTSLASIHAQELTVLPPSSLSQPIIFSAEPNAHGYRQRHLLMPRRDKEPSRPVS